MTAQLKQLKTHRTKEKEVMLVYLEDLVKQVKEDKIESIIVIAAGEENVQTEVLGDVTCMEAIGMLSTAQLSYSLCTIDGPTDGD